MLMSFSGFAVGTAWVDSSTQFTEAIGQELMRKLEFGLGWMPDTPAAAEPASPVTDPVRSAPPAWPVWIDVEVLHVDLTDGLAGSDVQDQPGVRALQPGQGIERDVGVCPWR